MRRRGITTALIGALLLSACSTAPAPAPVPSEPAPSASATLGTWAEPYVGRWIPRDYAGELDPDLVLKADGSWEAWDGCNGTIGTWNIDPDGAVTELTAGPSTLIYCEGVATAGLLQQAASLERVSDDLASGQTVEVLRLRGAEGEVILELVAAELPANPES